jgi:hypothetical protein
MMALKDLLAVERVHTGSLVPVNELYSDLIPLVVLEEVIEVYFLYVAGTGSLVDELCLLKRVFLPLASDLLVNF